MQMATVKGDRLADIPRKGAEERLRYLGLFDTYGPLLTPLQQEMCERSFLCDLSLSEIAEEKGVSKQAVSDTLKKSRELLDLYEEKLHIKRDNDEYSLAVSDMMTRVTRALGEFTRLHPEFSEEMAAIADMVAVGEVIGPDEED